MAKAKKIFITGIGGYLGSTFLSELPENYEIVGYSRGSNFAELKRQAKSQGQRLTLIKGDITNTDKLAEALYGANVVVHTAGIVGNGACLKEPWNAIKTNIRGTCILIDTIQSVFKKHTPRVVYVSTQSVYGTFRKLPMPLTERTRIAPDDFYGATKAEAEYEMNRIPSLIIRPTNIYGIGSGLGHEKNIVSRFCQMAYDGEPITLFGDGSQGIDFVHVRDVARAIIDVIESDIVVGVYNVGVGFATPMRDIARIVAMSTKGKDGKLKKIMKKEAPLGKLWPSRWVSYEKIKKAIGWKPLITNEEGIQEIVKYIYEHNTRR